MFVVDPPVQNVMYSHASQYSGVQAWAQEGKRDSGRREEVIGGWLATDCGRSESLNE